MSVLVRKVVGTRCGDGRSKEAAVHLRSHKHVWLQSPVVFFKLGAPCKAETKPTFINPGKQEQLTMHLPAGIDAGLNSEVSRRL